MAFSESSESEVARVQSLREKTQFFAQHDREIQQAARELIASVRKADTSPLHAFQHEYDLSSEEGLLLMCLAEALLRIPDTATADALIHDKLKTGHWDAHVGLGRPWFLNWAGHGLELAGIVADKHRLHQSAGAFMGGLVHRLGEPVVRRALRHAMRLMGNLFVLAGDMPDAQKRAEHWHGLGYNFSFDMLGEGARNNAQAEAYHERYLHAIHSLGDQPQAALYARDGISIKLSALHPRSNCANGTAGTRAVAAAGSIGHRRRRAQYPSYH